MLFDQRKLTMPTADRVLPGRTTPILPPGVKHAVLGRPLRGPYPEGIDTALFGLGCFWGAERLFWQLGSGIWVTAVGYAGGMTPNPTYEEVCSGGTGHAEVVLVAFDPTVMPYAKLLKTFWEAHDPTQGFRQGNDVGTQYRSAIYTTSEAQMAEALLSKSSFGEALALRGHGAITTEIADATPFYFAEEYHQQYLDKVPGGYCGLKGTGVTCAS